MRKNVFAAALILALGVGSFAACSSDDVVTPQHGTETLGGTTFMTVKFSVPQGNAQRSHDYNYIGEWAGRDDVQSYKAYIFDGTTPSSTLEAVQVLTASDFSAAAVGNNYVITPTKAVRVKPGNKIVYVVVNPNPTTDALLPAALATTTYGQFKAAYESKNLATAGAGVYDATMIGLPTPTSSANLAKTTGTAAATKDVIVMTGKPAGVAPTTFTVIDGVSESDAATGVNNQASVEVKRTVARVVVTSTQTSYTLKGDDPYTSGTVETNYQIGEVKGLHFVTAQNERELFFQQAENAANTSTTDKWDSPAFGQTATDDYGDDTKSQPADILKKYDYTNLWKNRANANVLGGNEVHQASPTTPGTWTPQEIGQLFHDTDFILPTTHKFVAIAPNAPYEYRKGNTAYVLVRAAFVPKQIQVGADYTTANLTAAMTSGNLPSYITELTSALAAYPTLSVDATTGNINGTVAPTAWTSITPGTEPAELVYGVGTHKFYSSEFASQNPAFQGVSGQPIQKFKKVQDDHGNFLGYKMLYFAWVNPDDVTNGWYNSPVYRNNIYHVEINGIGGLGENWNPLVPAVPGKPSNNPTHPNNPDPFVPNGSVTIPVPPTGGTPVTPTPVTPPVTPVTPIKPSDPLTQKKTHMSVKVTVLPWQVHSYKFILQN